MCNAVLLDDIIEAVCPDAAENFDEEWTDHAGEPSMSSLTYADMLCYVDNIRWFACACDEISDLLPDITALERTLMWRGWANVQQKK